MDAAVQEAKDQAELNELLIWASARGLVADAVELIARGSEPNTRDKQGLTPAHYAAAQGHLDALQYLATKGADLEAEDSQARMPLHHAAIGAHLEVLRFLIQRSTWLDVADADDNTALHLAARRGWVPGLKLLLTAEAAINIPNKRSLNALGEAIAGSHVAAAQALMQAGADATWRAAGYTLLHVAAGLGQFDTLQMLLQDSKCSILVNDTANGDSASPLHAAAMAGSAKCVQLLLEHGADASLPGSDSLLPWEVVTAESPAATEQLSKLLQDAAGGSKGGSARKPNPYATANSSVGSATTVDKGAGTASPEEASSAGPVAAYSMQFAALNATEQGRKVDNFAHMHEKELEQLSFLNDEAKQAISQVRRALQLLGCYRAVAALRSDETFQEDASEAAVQAALHEIGLTNNFEKYKDDRQVMSVAAKLKKFHAVLQECGGIRMGLQDILVKPGQTLEELMAKDEQQIQGLTAAAAHARSAAVAAIGGRPSTAVAARALMGTAVAQSSSSSDAVSAVKPMKGAAAAAASEIQAVDSPVVSELDLDAQLQQAKAEAAAAVAKTKHKLPEEMEWKERLLYEVINSFKQAVKIMCMVLALWGVMWCFGLLPGQQDPQLLEERMIQMMKAKELAAQEQQAGHGGEL